MSDFTEAVDTPEGDAPPVEDAPSEASEYVEYDGYDEQADDGGEGSEGEAISEPSFTVKVDGQEVEVAQSELVAGYQRQADYTRKTQQLADQRKDLQDAQALLNALQRNPHQTLAVLAQAYGIPVGGGEQQNGETEYQSDEERRVAQLESWQATEVQRQREAQIDRTLTQLHQQYGEFSDDDLFSFAVAKNVMDLETALRAMRYDAGTPNPPRRSEKRAAGAVANGGSRNGATPRQDDEEIESVRDAWAAAKRMLNAT
jgi:hypothetical protein